MHGVFRRHMSFTGLLRWARGVSSREQAGLLRRAPRPLTAAGNVALWRSRRDWECRTTPSCWSSRPVRVCWRWTHTRFPSLAPERLGRTILHAATAFVLLKLTSMFGESSTTFAVVFLFVLPALVYALLCTIWVLRHAQTALGLSR